MDSFSATALKNKTPSSSPINKKYNEEAVKTQNVPAEMLTQLLSDLRDEDDWKSFNVGISMKVETLGTRLFDSVDEEAH